MQTHTNRFKQPSDTCRNLVAICPIFMAYAESFFYECVLQPRETPKTFGVIAHGWDIIEANRQAL